MGVCDGVGFPGREYTCCVVETETVGVVGIFSSSSFGLSPFSKVFTDEDPLLCSLAAPC